MPATERATYQFLPIADAIALIRAESAVTIFDVRDLAAYRQGHIAEAAHLSEYRLLAWFRRLPKDRPVVIYCYKGSASQTYAQMFVDFGFMRVFSVDEGYASLAAALVETAA